MPSCQPKQTTKEDHLVATCFQLWHEIDDLLAENARCNDALIAMKTERQRKRKHHDSWGVEVIMERVVTLNMAIMMK